MKMPLISLLTLVSAATLAQSLDNLFETALGTAGLNLESAKFDPATLPFYYKPQFESLLARQVSQSPWRTPWLMRNFRDELSTSTDRPADVLATASRLMGTGVTRSLIGNPIARAEEGARRRGALTTVLNTYRERGILRGPVPSFGGVPDPVQEAAALVLLTALDVSAMRRAALLKVNAPEAYYNRLRSASVDSNDPEMAARMFLEEERVDLPFLLAGAQDLALASTAARGRLLGVAADEKFDVRISTVWGDILLTGGGATEHTGTFFLIIDTGGNDTYYSLPATKSITNWTSIVLDGDGNDRYLSDRALATSAVADWPGRKGTEAIGPGAAYLGYAMLFDQRGDDLYRSHRPGLAAAFVGASILSDNDGRDVYDTYTQALGFATFGAAVLEDTSGNDSYRGFNAVQGHGGVNGFAALLDRQGNDRYEANDQVIDFPSPQTGQSNVSLAQGAGVGRRADFTDGHSQSGGIGLLMDGDGDDVYRCGVFGQGVGYWGGFGGLLDRAGNDRYEGRWYVQGSAAHFATGYLEDELGADTYVATMNMAQGSGHDFSLGMLLDREGGDSYQAPNLSLGSGNANGIGAFLDFGGNDVYASSGLTLGRAAEAPKGSLRERCLTLGLFYDGEGVDTYPDSTNWARNAARITNWTDRGFTASESQLGIFWDR